METIYINDRPIGPNHRPFIIAELSGNHNQSLERALLMVEKAAEAGVDAIKLQTYTAETMTLNVNHSDFVIQDEQSIWKERSLYQLYEEAHTPWEWHETIFNTCKELGVIAFSSPFDSSAVDFLETLDVPCYKVASFECTDLPLIQKIAKTGKPMIISTGMATVSEIDEAVRTAEEAGCKNLILLKCTSTYPATPENSNISTIPHMQKLFGYQVGLSDHTLGVGVPVASVALGATVIEKHFTLARADGGVDAEFSLEPNEFKALVEETKRAWQSLGSVQYGPISEEVKSKQLRRSVYITKDVKAGEVLNQNNIRIIRPGYGLPPKYFNTLIGKRINQDVKSGTPTSWDLIG
ncbi:pseudaminic acid synthase [Alkalibacillus haloalkaliphilus]|uniref:Pseudaminic acid synthase n=1 Tax=Alkalibacillus haloalkaliphilus TaxID=94136 RepID=A0A511W595_9BACI|nr:pseudaminic acid synthase [Alkalibacillus haloalkaliphilus]GEN45508.1 pseudaminic acid synthase [Alkalibacillus haloalkaliphilus]